MLPYVMRCNAKIHQLPTMGFDNLNSLETLNLQNNKLQHIPEEIMEPILDTLRVVDIMDNPLICDCDLAWYESWLAGLRDRDDEMMQKKRTVCTMVNEHREYSLAKMPLEKMNCKRKPGYGPSSAAHTCPILAINFIVLATRGLYKGWLRLIVQTFFGMIIVASFTLILTMSLKSRQLRPDLLSRCRVDHCRVLCFEAPYLDDYEDDIIEAAWQANANCPHVVLTLNRPLFTNATLTPRWMSKIRSNINELAIIGGNLKHIPTGAFSTQLANNLNTLILENIEISSWGPETFVGLSSLKQLYIKDCVYNNISQNALQAVDDTLEFLDIKANFLWNPVSFTGSADLRRLETVDFSSNPFYTILDRTSFSELRVCKKLFLNSCRINFLGPGTFDALDRIEKLYLHDNYLIIIPDDLFGKVIPRRPRITLQDNLWYCNCSQSIIRDLEGLLIVDPICRYPDSFNGVTFSEFRGQCEMKNSPELPEIGHENISSTCYSRNDTKTFHINGVCHNSTCEVHKVTSQNYYCRLNTSDMADMTRAIISKEHPLVDGSDWLSLSYSVRSNHQLIVELSSKNALGQGLLWFDSTCPSEIYCMNAVPDVLRVYDERIEIQYTFCPFNSLTGEINPEQCVFYSLADLDNTVLKTHDLLLIIGFTILSIVCLIFGAICVYALIQRNPHLLKGNKRILFVKHKEINALILPPKVPLRKSIDDTDLRDKIEKKIFFVSTHHESLSNVERSYTSSNEVSYISALQPTDEQLEQWRKKQNDLKKQYKSLTSEVYQFSNIFDTESLPYYSLSERIYDTPNVTKN
ncbi:unnamed protein product [Leptosia nina]|uniref:LRRCT domain-containing protein n=1 Tax=Leptosia nina TaxID=320188 RepID=A0AAV1J707_9NEOP